MTKEINPLENWDMLNEHVKTLDEKAVKALIEKEKKGQNRPQFLLRMYGRFNRLRTARERRELMSNSKSKL